MPTGKPKTKPQKAVNLTSEQFDEVRDEIADKLTSSKELKDALVDRLLGSSAFKTRLIISVSSWAALVVLILGIVGWGRLEWVKREITAKAEADLNLIRAGISNRLATIESDVSNQLMFAKGDIGNRISEEFESVQIRKTVSEVASGEAKSLLEAQIQPEVAAFKEEVASRLAVASHDIEALTNAARLSLTILAAQANDRAAFDRLTEWANDPAISSSEISRQAMFSIMDLHNRRDADPLMPEYFAPWGSEPDPKWDLEKLKLVYWRDAYDSRFNQLRIGLLQALWKREDISRSNKLAFTVDVLKKDPDLQAVSAAGYLFRKNTGFNMKTLAVPEFLAWWERSSTTITN